MAIQPLSALEFEKAVVADPRQKCPRRYGCRLELLVVCILSAVLVTFLQQAIGEQRNYFHHQVWSTEDGLPQESVHALLQSREGYLWIGTEDGAARFDGQSFRVLNHALIAAFLSNDVSCIAEDNAGDIWLGTSDGLIRKHGEEYRRFSQREGLPSDEVVALAASSDDLLVLTTGGLAMWQRDHFERIATNEVITGIAGSERGILVVSKQGTVYRWTDGELVATTPAVPNESQVVGVAMGREKAIWSYGSNFVHLSSPSQNKIWHMGIDLPGSRVQTLYVDRQGTAWVGTNRGLVSMNAPPGLAVRDSEPLRGESVLSVLADREGDLWVGTEASGLHSLQPRKFATVPGSASEAVTTVIRESRGMMIFGTRDDGIFRADGTPVAIAAQHLTSPVILSLAAGPDGDLWAGTPDGLNQITGTHVRHWTIADGLPDNFVRSVIVAPDKSVWAGTRFGLVHIDSIDAHVFTRADGLASDSIGPLLQVGPNQDETSGLWIGTSAGLCRMTSGAFHCLASPYPQNASIITALAADREGFVWVALHDHGIGVVTADRIVPVPVPATPAEIVGLLADNRDSLWLRSKRGLYRATRSELRGCIANASRCSGVKVDAYSRADGMQSEEVADEGIPSLAEGPAGELWAATRRGIAVTDPQHNIADAVPPGVVITQVHVDGRELPIDKTAEIQPGHRQYSFEYAGVSLNNAARTHCRYKLDGFDRAWVDAGSRGTAYYTNLPPRQYSFNVQCANSAGLWSNQEAKCRFHVLKPWYRSAWVYIPLLGLVALTVFGFVQMRVRAERRRFELVLRERTRVAREVHDTLAQDLVSVSLQVEMAAQHAKAGRLPDVMQQLTETRLLVRQALDSARQSIWNLRANLSSESLPVRLTARVEASRLTAIASRLRISGEYRSAPAVVENEVMRIATEVISNAERHSDATEITVDLSYGAESLRLQVGDNGCGFDYASARSKTGHYGLRGLEERAALIDAELKIHSNPGTGTTVTLIAPLTSEKS